MAASQLDLPLKLVSCVGFGIDAHHGVASTDVLERLAELARSGAYLGALSIPADSPEATAYLDAVGHAALHNVHGRASSTDRSLQPYAASWVDPDLPGGPLSANSS